MIILDTWVQSDCTIGRMRIGNFQCLSLELPWKNNGRGISCIPAGEYFVSKYESPSKGLVLLLHGVPERSWIEIHAGTYTHQTRGCILVGDSIAFLDSDSIPDVLNSRETLLNILSIVPQNTSIRVFRSA